jgi:hypothetical protein
MPAVEFIPASAEGRWRAAAEGSIKPTAIADTVDNDPPGVDGSK